MKKKLKEDLKREFEKRMSRDKEIKAAISNVHHISHWTDPHYTDQLVFQEGKPYLECAGCRRLFSPDAPYKILKGLTYFYHSAEKDPRYCKKCLEEVKKDV